MLLDKIEGWIEHQWTTILIILSIVVFIIVILFAIRQFLGYDDAVRESTKEYISQRKLREIFEVLKHQGYVVKVIVQRFLSVALYLFL